MADQISRDFRELIRWFSRMTIESENASPQQSANKWYFYNGLNKLNATSINNTKVWERTFIEMGSAESQYIAQYSLIMKWQLSVTHWSIVSLWSIECRLPRNTPAKSGLYLSDFGKYKLHSACYFPNSQTSCARITLRYSANCSNNEIVKTTYF